MNRLSNAQLRVLVVDDNIDAASMLVMLFMAMGIDAHAAFGGRDAVLQAEAMRPNVMFVDLDMPDMSGCDVVRHLRHCAAFASIAIFALTGNADPLACSKAMDSGFSGFLLKPASSETLIQILTNIAAPQR